MNDQMSDTGSSEPLAFILEWTQTVLESSSGWYRLRWTSGIRL